MKLLLAEDDPVSREILASAARKAGWEVTAVADGQAAWDQLLREDFSAVLSDWRMPVIDGTQLCRKLRARGSPDYIYFILVTASVWNHEGYLQAMEAGVDDFLNKTAEPLEITMRLKVAERISRFARRLSQLEGIIPMCSHCRRLRDEKSIYHRMEAFFNKKSHLTFSHGICPECMDRHYPLEVFRPVEPGLAQDVLHQAPARESGLQQVRADEGGKPKKSRIDPMSKSKAQQNEGSGDGADAVF